MTGNRNDFVVRHIGLDIDFHHPEGDLLKLSPDIEDRYGLDKEKAAIFTESASGLKFSSEDMLTWYLSRSGKTLSDFLSGSDPQSSRIAVTFPIQFSENTFHMMTEQGAVDIKSLRLAVEISPQDE